MLENFRKTYNKELKLYEHEGELTRLILNSTEVRAFVYEVCKACVTSQPINSADGEYYFEWVDASNGIMRLTKCR